MRPASIFFNIQLSNSRGRKMEKGVLPGFCLWNKSCDFQAGKRKSGIREGIYFAGRGRLCGSVPGRKGTGI